MRTIGVCPGQAASHGEQLSERHAQTGFVLLTARKADAVVHDLIVLWHVAELDGSPL
ncbi:MAG: hypothetical protein ACRDKJ_00845 [Actinomycetota bacterium]